MRILLILSFIIYTFQGNAQLLKLQSTDSLNGKPIKQFYTTAWLKFSGFYDFVGIPNESAMHLPSIPTDRENITKDPQYHADLNQTRLKFASTFQTKKLGEIMSYIETDFYGNGGGGLRLRHAYVRFLNFRIGQTWSGFTDEEAWPNITDFDGPATGAWVRSAQITYFVRPNENQDILFAIEKPSQDYSRYLEIDSLVQPALQNIPDFVTHYEIRWKKGHFQLAGVARAIEYQDQNNNTQRLFGWGFNLSGSQIFGERDTFIWQGAGGEGIARYLVSFGGGGWDAIPNFEGHLITVPVYGGYLGYQHFWNKAQPIELEKSSFSSTIVYGYVHLKNPLGDPAPSLLTGSYASANIYWHVVGPLNFAAEAIYGFRTDEYESSGDNLRIQFIMEYNF
ncbi:MAG: hypothetical protein JXR07_01935 [Reichenbachiella sp.]